MEFILLINIFFIKVIKYSIYWKHFFLFKIGEEEKEEEVKDAVADEPKVEDAPQDEAFEDEQEETNDEKVSDEEETEDEDSQDVKEQDQEGNLNYWIKILHKLLKKVIII